METKLLHTIMLIDDNDLDNLINSTLIRRNKLCSVILEMKSGIKAIDYLRRNENDASALPDLILLDVSMPEMDGYQFLYELQRFVSTLTKIPQVFMLSSSLNDSDIRKAKENPLVSGYLTKPFQPNLLLEHLNKAKHVEA